MAMLWQYHDNAPQPAPDVDVPKVEPVAMPEPTPEPVKPIVPVLEDPSILEPKKKK